jgi:hypothetical protein
MKNRKYFYWLRCIFDYKSTNKKKQLEKLWEDLKIVAIERIKTDSIDSKELLGIRRDAIIKEIVQLKGSFTKKN